jgi:3-oxoacyl-[acyl-carrier protein] reductase
LAGQCALVTGAGRGIGRAVALALAAAGAKVALLARSKAQIEQVAAEIRANGGTAVICPCDVALAGDIAASVAECHRRLRRLDILVNNAGVFLDKPVPDVTLDEWEHVLRVNATAPFLFCRAVLPLMQKQGGGRIVNVASTAGVQGYLGQAAYCASKHALLGFSRCLAIEAKPSNIHVYTLCPGGVRTDFVAGTQLGKRLAGQPMIEPENMGDMVVFLLSQPPNVDIAEVVVRRFVPG